MKLKWIWRSAIVLSIIILGYLFIWPSDLQVTFKTKAIPGTINQAIKLWANSLEKAEFIAQKDLEHFSHKIWFNDSIHTYTWNIKALNDSTSQVKVYITDQNNSFSNRLSVLFADTDFEKRSKKALTELAQALKEHVENFKVGVIGIDQITAKYCAYIPLESSQVNKALKMMENYPILNNVLAKHKIELDGAPFIEVNNWDIQKDSISFNFCYPIIKSDTLPQIDGILYKEIPNKQAIKAIYNGNYITSDRAWYTLIDYASKNSIEIKQEPLEIFYSNPNMGGDELTWKAEIFMPLKE